jgi:D-glycero-D-manno-heptose 1,7-bisphosphate phosphatase
MTAISAGSPAAFLDRDGVINRDHGYVSRWEDFEFLPGAVDALRGLQRLGFQLVVVTNQSGIGRGYYQESDFQTLMASLTSHLAHEGVALTDSYFCPHHPTDAEDKYRMPCECRKPAPGMLLAAARDHDLALDASILVGDKPSDIEAGESAGVARCYQVTSGTPVSGAVGVASLAAVLRHEQERCQKL